MHHLFQRSRKDAAQSRNRESLHQREWVDVTAAVHSVLLTCFSSSTVYNVFYFKIQLFDSATAITQRSNKQLGHLFTEKDNCTRNVLLLFSKYFDY